MPEVVETFAHTDHKSAPGLQDINLELVQYGRARLSSYTADGSSLLHEFAAEKRSKDPLLSEEDSVGIARKVYSRGIASYLLTRDVGDTVEIDPKTVERYANLIHMQQSDFDMLFSQHESVDPDEDGAPSATTAPEPVQMSPVQRHLAEIRALPLHQAKRIPLRYRLLDRASDYLDRLRRRRETRIKLMGRTAVTTAVSVIAFSASSLGISFANTFSETQEAFYDRSPAAAEATANLASNIRQNEAKTSSVPRIIRYNVVLKRGDTLTKVARDSLFNQGIPHPDKDQIKAELSSISNENNISDPNSVSENQVITIIYELPSSAVS